MKFTVLRRAWIVGALSVLVLVACSISAHAQGGTIQVPTSSGEGYEFKESVINFVNEGYGEYGPALAVLAVVAGACMVPFRRLRGGAVGAFASVPIGAAIPSLLRAFGTATGWFSM